MNRNQRRALEKGRKKTQAAGQANAGINDLYKKAQEELKAGRFTAADAMLRQVVAAYPDNGRIRYFAGRALAGLGRHEEALAHYDVAVTSESGIAEHHPARAATLKALGRAEEAAQAFIRVLEIEPGHADSHFQVVLMKGQIPSLGVDLAALNAMLDRKSLAQAYKTIANILQLKKNMDHALLCLHQAVDLTPDDAEMWHRLGAAQVAARQPAAALDSFARVFALAPDERYYRISALRAFHKLGFKDYNEERRDMLMTLLSTPDLEYNILFPAWRSLFFLSPDMAGLSPLLEASSYEAFTSILDSMMDRDVFSHPFLLAGCEKMILSDVRIERLMTRLRRWLLSRALRKDVPDDMLLLLRVLAIQCFYNEYVYALAPDEAQDAARLMAVLNDDPPDLSADAGQASLLVASCYEPLFLWAGESLAARMEAHRGNLDDIIQTQWHEPREERGIAAALPALRTIADEVSLKVQAQYEENPYPRWRHIILGAKPNLPPEVALQPRERAYDILIAGCGTGKHAITTALEFPKSRLTAVDLSRASISYSMRQARALDVGNIDFMQADILDLGRLAQQFDIVECSGVMHHMDDPVAGWAVLNDILKPGGYMRIGLYSELARQHIVKARDYIAQWGLGSDVDSIRQGRQRIMAMTDDPAMQHLATGRDFYTTSSCRDLIFHVQEHRFTLPQIGEILDGFGLKLAAFTFMSTTPLMQYHKMFAAPDGSCDTADIANWHAYEQEHPATFAGMYQFWARKI